MTRHLISALTIVLCAASTTWATPDPQGTTPPEGTMWLNPGENGSFGWYQRYSTVAGMEYDFAPGKWTGDIGGSGWAEVMFFSVPWGTSDADVVTRIDMGDPADIYAKRDSWGYGGGPVWSWESAGTSTTISTSDGGDIVVAMKLGSGGGGDGWVSFDSLSLLGWGGGEDGGNPYRVNVLVNGDFGTGDETGWTRWGASWGHIGNYAITPEPATLCLLGLGALAVTRRRR